MKESLYGELTVIGMKGCEKFAERVDYYLKEWRRHGGEDTYLAHAECPRFGSGEGKAIIQESMRGQDVYIICDMFNYGVSYKLHDMIVPMSPDDHYADLKRIIAAIGGKARRITVIMPMLYEGRQHKRTARESLDCAMMLQELVRMGVSNIITFDAHDPRVANAIPLSGFDNVMPNYQMIKALVRAVPDVVIDPMHTVMISPDEGAMSRCIAYSSSLGLDIGMFYKRRDYSTIVNGKNPILEHKYLGQDLEGKDVIIVDDMISSGGSLLDVATQLKTIYKAKRVFNFATFGLFTDGFKEFDEAYEKGIIDKIFTTNLVYRKPEIFKKPWYVEVNMCKYVSYIIDTLNHDNTISELLKPDKRIAALLEKHKAELAEQGQMAIKFENL
ncbi:MAG: ribose-phosphate pyrophosphokinase [Clostridia bacterium]|nr:ribose-phosphate pyrophosphokinase [Clostridia bacterium]MBQ7316896.1 ribose-phosphate pyrophosphokinase [Clostridia bacterium]